jgi:Zn-dependent protease
VGRSGGPNGGSLATRDIRGHLWFTRFDALNAAIGILGYYSLLVAAFNLIPLRSFDGATAWNLVPELIKRNRNRRKNPKRVVGWRGW